MLYQLFAAVVMAAAAVGDELPPSCDRPVYCDSELLHRVQLAGLYNDSKTFVDLQLVHDENTTLAAFQTLLNETNDNPTKEQLQDFVDRYFHDISELEMWVPHDFSESPTFLSKIRDPELRQYAKDLNGIWPTLARKVKPIVFEKPELFSFIPITNGFIIPGGRFKEIYYWDAYWIIEGLLISGMQDTARGMIENLIELLNKLGHIPNGSRCYYQRRSQPPLLSAMMKLYYEWTNDIDFLKKHIESLEMEMNYWLETQSVTFQKDDKVFTLLRYYAPSKGPRPESYKEDYNDAHSAFSDEKRITEFYVDIKSAAESGWDFSTRWFIDDNATNAGNLSEIHTRYIIPVDMNSIFAAALQNTADFNSIIGNSKNATSWGLLAKQWKSDTDAALWHKEDGIWYDYDTWNQKHRRYFYTSNFSPLWMEIVDESVIKSRASSILKYLKDSTGLDHEGGIPVSLQFSGEQWDFPNVWPPEVSIVIDAIEILNTKNSTKLAFHLAQEWVRICYKGYKEYKQMFEKYDARQAGKFGFGGEYTVQAGFGWSNGVIFEYLDKYGAVLSANDALPEEETSSAISAVAQQADNRAHTFDTLGVVPLMIGSNYVKNLWA